MLAKRAELANLTQEEQPDIIFGSETWLSPNINCTEFLPTGYTVFRKDRSDGYGGVLLAFKESLTVTEYHIENKNLCEIIACTLRYGSQKVILCSIYRPPSSDATYLQELIKILEEVVINNPTIPIWIAGDINLPNIDWNKNTVVNNCYPLVLCNSILDFIADHGFSQTVQTPTRNQNILDIFLTNRPSTVSSCDVISGISDHEIVCISSTVSVPYTKKQERNIFIWHKANFDSINDHITDFTDTFLQSHDHNDPIDILWNEYKALCEACLAMIPQRKSTKHQIPWITNNIKRLSRKKQRQYNLARRTNTDENWSAYRNLKKEVQRLCRSSHNKQDPKYIGKIHFTEFSSKMEHFWQKLQQLHQKIQFFYSFCNLHCKMCIITTRFASN